jgi:hypothetical protein
MAGGPSSPPLGSATLAFGGYLGEEIIFVYGNRVPMQADAPVSDVDPGGPGGRGPAQSLSGGP